MGVVVKHVGGPAIAPGSADPFKFSTPGHLSTALQKAGFAEVEEETRTVAWTWPGTVEEAWEYGQSISVPFRSLLERVPRREWERVNADVHAAIREYWDGSSVNFGAVLVFGSGKKL
jgi:hypothetical protein